MDQTFIVERLNLFAVSSILMASGVKLSGQKLRLIEGEEYNTKSPINIQ